MTATRESIAAEVRAELARQGKPQIYLCEYLGLDKAAVSQRLRGNRPFKAEELVVVAQALGVSVAQFTERAA